MCHCQRPIVPMPAFVKGANWYMLKQIGYLPISSGQENERVTTHRGAISRVVYVIKVIVGFILPPGLFVLLLVIAGLTYRHLKPLPMLALVFALVIYVCSIPLTADFLMRSLESKFRPASSQSPALQTADVLIMLGGGATLDTPSLSGQGNLSGSGANRLLTIASLYRQTKLPIILSGGQVFPDDGNEAQIAKRELMLLGVPETKIITEDKSKNTEQNALYTNVLLQRYGFRHPVLVTSAFHMQRSVLDFHLQGVSVVPYPTDYQSSLQPRFYINQFVPSAHALSLTSTAVHEYLGISAAKLGLPS